MTENFYRTGTYKSSHSTFGGRIYLSDFETDYRGKNNYESPIAQRIASDHKFDDRCRRNIDDRKNNRIWRNY